MTVVDLGVPAAPPVSARRRETRRPVVGTVSAEYGKATPEALAGSAWWEASLFAEHDFHQGRVVKTVREHEIVETLVEEATRIAERVGEAAGGTGKTASAGAAA